MGSDRGNADQAAAGAESVDIVLRFRRVRTARDGSQGDRYPRVPARPARRRSGAATRRDGRAGVDRHRPGETAAVRRAIVVEGPGGGAEGRTTAVRAANHPPRAGAARPSAPARAARRTSFATRSARTWRCVARPHVPFRSSPATRIFRRRSATCTSAQRRSRARFGCSIGPIAKNFVEMYWQPVIGK